jgi:UPF0716 protein FxsA
LPFVLTFFLAVVVFSSAELFLLLKVAANFGFFTAFAACVLTGILGGALVRSQGLNTLKNIQAAAARNELPAEEIVGGAMLIVIGALLMVPGFITDALGFLMLIPTVRHRVARLLINRVASHVQWRVVVPTGGVPPADMDGTGDHPGRDIETEAIRRTPEE